MCIKRYELSIYYDDILNCCTSKTYDYCILRSPQICSLNKYIITVFLEINRERIKWLTALIIKQNRLFYTI